MSLEEDISVGRKEHGHELDHIPQGVWIHARSLAPTEDLVWEILKLENERVCRDIPERTRRTTGRKRWQDLWKQAPFVVQHRLKQRVNAILSARAPKLALGTPLRGGALARAAIDKLLGIPGPFSTRLEISTPTREQLEEARTFRATALAHPTFGPILTSYGLQHPSRTGSDDSDEFLQAFQRNRAELESEPILDEIARSASWLRAQGKRKGINPDHTSYGYKHMVERVTDVYISNGAFIAAALGLGIKVRDMGGLNLQLAIQPRSPHSVRPA